MDKPRDPNEPLPNPTVDIVLRVPVEVNSKLFELMQASSRIGLQVSLLKQHQKPVPNGLKSIYEDADKKLKDELMNEFEFPVAIYNLVWDTDFFLSFAEHCVILAPEG